jgi:hypothetical protein
MVSTSISRLRACVVLLCLLVGAACGAAAQEASAGLTGSVVDGNGGIVPDAQVQLVCGPLDKPLGQYQVTSDSAGRFHFSSILAGVFHLKVAADGFVPTSSEGTLEPGATLALPPVVLRIAYSNTLVDVVATQQDIAQEEVHAEEQQRVIGFVPNYFVTYSKNVVPLTAKQKYSLGLHVILDPTHFLFAGIAAGIEQADDAFPGYHQGAAGYGKRYGASLADSTTATLLRGSVYPALFHQDPRYFYKGTGTNWERTKYALATAVICKGDNGHWQPNYSDLLGELTAAGISNIYYAPSDRHGAALTFENAFLGLAGVGVGHLMQEFVFKHLTKNVPKGD